MKKIVVALSFCLVLAAACRGDLVPLAGPGPVAVEKLRVGNPAVLPVDGEWKFQISKGEDDADGRFIPAMRHSCATASSSQDWAAPDQVFAAGGGHWCAASGAFPQWWQVDLGDVRQVDALELTLENSTFVYRLEVEGSLDGKAWRTLAKSSADTGSKKFTFLRATVRYLRVVFISASDRDGHPKWAYLEKVKITVAEDGHDKAWTPRAKVDASALAEADAFARSDYDDSRWASLAVPGNWEMAGFSRPTYNQPDNAIGLYRRWVEVPKNFQGRRVLWHFDGVFDSAEVFVNGRRVGYHEGGFTAFDVDATAAIRPGEKNLLAVRVCKKTFSVDLDTGDFWSLGGIYRENYLVALPLLRVGDVCITTPLAPDNTASTFNAAVEVRGEAGQAFTLTGKLYAFDGKPVDASDLSAAGVVGPDGAATVRLGRDIPHPKLWSAEHPDLYYFVARLATGGREVEAVQERFGFREIKIVNGVLLWNGVPVKLTGVDRHEEWARLGHALDEAAWRRDVELIKAANINAVRTSHYNPARRFLELCDEKGLYVLDEVPGCWCDPKDPALEPAWLQHTRETFARDKNSPGIIAWSIGNESGIGPDNIAAFELMKRLDPTRPAFISQCGLWNLKTLDFDDFHYPGLDALRSIAASPDRKTTPFVITEGPHIFYNDGALSYDYGVKDFWGQALANQWAILWKTDSALGAFIWEWQDQGLALKVDASGNNRADPVAAGLAGTKADAGADKAPTSDAETSSPLFGNNNKGIVDGFRNPKPEYYQIKMVYSPVVIDARAFALEGDRVTFPLRNRYSFTDLADLDCRWTQSRAGKVLARGDAHFSCPPRTASEGAIPVAAGGPPDTVFLEFVGRDGGVIYSVRLGLPGAKPPAAPAPLVAGEGIKLSETAATWVVAAGPIRLHVGKQTGRVQEWSDHGRNLIKDGPFLNLGELRPYHGEHNWTRGLPPFLQSARRIFLGNVSTDAKQDADGAITITVRGDARAAESSEPKGRVTYTLRMTSAAQIDVEWKLSWTGEASRLFETGVTFDVPGSFDTLSWARNAPWTDYPAGYIGAAEGSATSGSLSFRSSKRDVYWALLSGKSPVGLAIVAKEGPLHVRARNDGGGVTLFLNSAEAPPPDFSTDLLRKYEITLKPGDTIGGSFRLQLTRDLSSAERSGGN